MVIVLFAKTAVNEYLSGFFDFFVYLFPGAAVCESPSDGDVDSGIFISLGVLVSYVEAYFSICGLDVNVCVE